MPLREIMSAVVEASADTAVEKLSKNALDGKIELPDDSGERKYSLDLPDDSGERMPISSLVTVTREVFGVTKELSVMEKAIIRAETGWSNEVINAIGSIAEYEIYKRAGLVETEISGKKCLIRPDIDMAQKDEFGKTNKERMDAGKPPITKDGETIELHHIGQKADSPLAELTTQEHRGKGNDTILHDKQKDTEIDRVAFSKERELHWVARANSATD